MREALMRPVAGGAAAICVVLVLACSGAMAAPQSAAGPAGANEPGLQINSELRVQVQRGREVELLVQAAPGDDYESIAERFAGSSAQAEALAAWNGERPPRDGNWIVVPLVLLSSDYRALVLRSLFPEDRREGEDWIHVARSGPLPTYDEGLWQVARVVHGQGRRLRRS